MIMQAKLEGITALLMHRFSEESEVKLSKSTRTITTQQKTPREQADAVAYRTSEGLFYLPSVGIFQLLLEQGRNHKQTGSRRSVKYAIPGAVTLVDEQMYITDHAGDPITDFEVDSRPVVIPATKGRIMRHRPRFDTWATSIDLRINDGVLPPEVIYMLLVEGGMRCGIGDYRPQKSGPFGQFIVTEWKEIADPLKEAA